MANPRTTARFAEVLIKARLIDELQLKSALAHVHGWGSTLPRAIGELGFADEDAVVDALAKFLEVPVIHLGNVLKDHGALRSLGVDYCEKYGVFPMSLKDRVLTLAMADPSDLDVVDDAGSMARARVQVMMAAESEIRWAIAKHFRGQELPRRRTVSSVRDLPEPGEERLEFELRDRTRPSAPIAPGRRVEESFDFTASSGFSPEEVRRLEAAVQNQEKVSHILRTVEELLAAKGLK